MAQDPNLISDRMFTKYLDCGDKIQAATEKFKRGEFMDQNDYGWLAVGANLALLEISRRKFNRYVEENEMLTFQIDTYKKREQEELFGDPDLEIDPLDDN